MRSACGGRELLPLWACLQLGREGPPILVYFRFEDSLGGLIVASVIKMCHSFHNCIQLVETACGCGEDDSVGLDTIVK